MLIEKEKAEISERLVRAYVLALNTLSVEPLIDCIHPDFVFKWKNNFGIKSELRYLGFLCKAFYKMKLEGRPLNAELMWIKDGTYKFPVVKIKTPVDTKIIYINEWSDDVEYTHNTDIIFYCRIKQNKLFRVIADVNISSDNKAWLFELKKTI